MLNNIVMISVCVQILLNPKHPLPMMTHLVLYDFYFWKAANPQLVLAEVNAGDLIGFVQSKVNHTETLSEASGNA